ncbi:MAG: 3-isopropylmalate dehydratase [Ignisphaera sp.]|nr:3-isopropylmalate dehydratase [Ignisphaera sp.]MCX8167609.1 3-isopropylmalate dehydratase [Ignisphaera sp.]MDW8086189.1 3-isopropylmalate dehydratase [Ignisphaera sp.]
MIRQGRCWKLGDNISTDHIISGKYKFEAINDINKMLTHLFEEVIPGFHKLVRPGDIVVAGRNFGKGSSREQAPRLLKMAGIGAVVAKSFAHIFYRNSINIGLPVVISRKVPDVTQNGDVIEINLVEGYVKNITRGVMEPIQPYPKYIGQIVEIGGIVEYIRRYGRPPWQEATR